MIYASGKKEAPSKVLMIHDVDGRDKPGHEGNGAVISAILLTAGDGLTPTISLRPQRVSLGSGIHLGLGGQIAVFVMQKGSITAHIFCSDVFPIALAGMRTSGGSDSSSHIRPGRFQPRLGPLYDAAATIQGHHPYPGFTEDERVETGIDAGWIDHDLRLSA